MNEIRKIAPADAESGTRRMNQCPLCGRPLTMLYPEIQPGLRYAHCQHGHKIRLQAETLPERNAG